MGKWKQGNFKVGDDGPFAGFHQPLVRWNGWACPYLIKDAAETLMLSLKKWPGTIKAEFDQQKDCYVIQLEDEDSPDLFKGQDIRVGNERIHVYAIGNMSWTWQEMGEGKDVEDVELESQLTPAKGN